MPSPRPFSRSTLIYNRLEISICPNCGLFIAASRQTRLLKIAEDAHQALHRRPVAAVAMPRRRPLHATA